MLPLRRPRRAGYGPAEVRAFQNILALHELPPPPSPRSGWLRDPWRRCFRWRCSARRRAVQCSNHTQRTGRPYTPRGSRRRGTRSTTGSTVAPSWTLGAARRSTTATWRGLTPLRPSTWHTWTGPVMAAAPACFCAQRRWERRRGRRRRSGIRRMGTGSSYCCIYSLSHA